MIKGIARESLRPGTIIYERQLRPAEKQQFSAKAETLQVFAAAPHGAGTYRHAG